MTVPLDEQRTLCASISDFECRAILGPGLPMIVNARRRNIHVPKPLLDLGNVGLMVERVGRSRRAQGMRANLEPE
jgi:hypothetical protein